MAPSDGWQMAGNWYKGALHVHTTASDGRLDVFEVCRRYREKGFAFVCITDHWRRFQHDARTRGEDMRIIEGIELDGCDRRGVYYHVVAIGGAARRLDTEDFSTALDDLKAGGALLLWAHPHWTGNRLEDGLALPFDGMEIYTHAAQCEIGKGQAAIYWDAIMESRSDFIGVAVDDAHFRSEDPFYDGGWVMVNAADCSRDAILDAIRQGRFFSSRGPAFHGIQRNGSRIRIETSPVVSARLIGPRSNGKWRFSQTPFCETAFDIGDEWAYVRLEIEDEAGRIAWTNNLHSGSL